MEKGLSQSQQAIILTYRAAMADTWRHAERDDLFDALKKSLKEEGFEIASFTASGHQVSVSKSPWPSVIGSYPVGGHGGAEEYLTSPYGEGSTFQDNGRTWMVVADQYRRGSPSVVSRYWWLAVATGTAQCCEVIE